MGRDLLSRPYGRFYFLPKLLASRGHDVRVALMDYDRGAREQRSVDGVRWVSASIANYAKEVGAQIRAERPDWIIGFSDTYFGILAARLAKKNGAKSCIDAYDNYESYLPWCRPLHWLWRRSLAKANLVTAAGPGLLTLMAGPRSARAAAVVPMAADPIFTPLDKAESRSKLGLPQNVPLVGYCGSAHRSRGVETLFSAMNEAAQLDPKIRFFHSGRTWEDVPLPASLTSLGYIDDEDVPYFVNAMDVLVVVNRSSAFGDHSYPVKLYEAIASGVPVVATRTLATEWIMKDHPQCLVHPGDSGALAKTIVKMLRDRSVAAPQPAGWERSCDALESALESAD